MSFHGAMKHILLLAQILGFMPVTGICQPQISALKFTWKSWRMLYSLLTLFGATFLSCTKLYKNLTKPVQMMDIYLFCLCLVGAFSSFVFILIAKKWPDFMRTWATMERAMIVYGWPKRLNRKINYLTAVFMILAFVEFFLFQMLEYTGTRICTNKSDPWSVFNTYLKNKFNSVYCIFAYDTFSAVLLMYVYFQNMFSCTFVDTFIMVLSVALAAWLRQIKQIVKTSSLRQLKGEIAWNQIREDYDRLERLCKTVNSTFSWLIILSFMGNVTFILIQLFHTVKVNSVIGKVSMYYSFGFLLLRTVCVSIYGASVNDESQRQLIYLNNVPDCVYNNEIERMIHQISSSNMALSGLNFFVIKRDLVLKIASALVAYELIIIQFHEETIKSVGYDTRWMCKI